MRVQLPNRPGALGAVATALGMIGADINLVEIVAKQGEIEIDEFILDLPSSETVESMVAACDDLHEVQVQWVRNYPRGGGIDTDLELLRRMSADSSRAGEILVAAAPLVFRAQWGLLLEVSSAPRVSFSTPAAPALHATVLRRFQPFDRTHRVKLERGWLPGWAEHHAVVAPIADSLAVVVGRQGEPVFFRSELARLEYLVGASGGTAHLDDQPPAAASNSPHRTPIATPLYIRDNVVS